MNGHRATEPESAAAAAAAPVALQQLSPLLLDCCSTSHLLALRSDVVSLSALSYC